MTDFDDARVKTLIVLLLLEFMRSDGTGDDDVVELMDQLAAEVGSERNALSALASMSASLMSLMLKTVNEDIDVAEILQDVSISGFGTSEDDA